MVIIYLQISDFIGHRSVLVLITESTQVREVLEVSLVDFLCVYDFLQMDFRRFADTQKVAVDAVDSQSGQWQSANLIAVKLRQILDG